MLVIGTRIKTVNLNEYWSDVHGIDNNDTGTVVGQGENGDAYLIKFDEFKMGSTTNIGCYLPKENLIKLS